MSGEARRPAASAAGTEEAAEPARKPRADGQRNRERLMEAAKAAFAEVGADVSLEEIARRAGVGIGTLYRHFPTRDAIVEAVYRREVEQLADAATRLIGSMPPGEALHEWMRLFVDYIATKKLIAAGPRRDRRRRRRELYASSGALITDACPCSWTARAPRATSVRTSIRATFCAPSPVSPTSIPVRAGGQARCD